MLFTIQSTIEDLIQSRGYQDIDGYAVELARLYYFQRAGYSKELFLGKIKRLRTVFFAKNHIQRRSAFESTLIEQLDARFKKKTLARVQNQAELGNAGRSLRRLERKTILRTLEKFRQYTEARGIKSLWLARGKSKLRERPEQIVQDNLGAFLAATHDGKAEIFREYASGVGFIDFGVLLSRTVHIVEVKVLTGVLKGLKQLKQYMKTEGKRRGYLLIIDARAPTKKTALPRVVRTPMGTIYLVPIEINPIPPSKL